ncbi:hypothetical protein PC129_g9059 [Phytophthora cactorum]|uniref:Uncharacterized protein n=1 Tax=Phytophthora cactorum TaxID=29920 RepID=A0A8T1IAJ5_9STRA|nr:hypothetical protein PC114_g6954 [Phytophthora cactorum]KAG3220172.1 hypothetical protein PC129_g9059 [Phytophthora cactorum]KAG4057778.1 hypothetical protein PC123_g7222 [Phytophthora cactorum]
MWGTSAYKLHDARKMESHSCEKPGIEKLTPESAQVGTNLGVAIGRACNAATSSSGALTHSLWEGGRRHLIESKTLALASPKNNQQPQRRTEYGADIDIEEALAEQLEIQRRSGRVLSSTASIAAALRQRPREDIPVFSTHLSNNEHREPSDPAIKAAVQEMQSLTPGYIGQTSEKPESLVDAKSPVVSKRVPSSRASSSAGSSFKIPESVPEDGEPEQETETETKDKEKSSPAAERPSEMNRDGSTAASAGRLEQHIDATRRGGRADGTRKAWHDCFLVCVSFRRRRKAGDSQLTQQAARMD